jgi:CHAT domain-containing protein
MRTSLRRCAFASVLLAAASSGCRPRRPLAAAPLPPGVEVSGCAALMTAREGAQEDVRCELAADRTLRLILRGPATAGWSVATEAGPIAGVERTALGEDPQGPQLERGERLRVSVPASATMVRLWFDATRVAAPWTLSITTARPVAAIDEARAMRDAGRADAAEATLSRFLTTATGEDRARASSLHARLALAAGRIDDAIPRFREAIALHRAAGRRSDEVDDTLALSYLLVQHARRFGEARAVLAELDARSAPGARGARDALRDYPDGRARRPYYAGAIALETGDLEGAIRELREARGRAERLGLARLVQMVDQQLAIALQRSGRNGAALALLDAMLARDGAAMSACDRADLLTNVGWVSLLAREARAGEASGAPADARDPTPPLERALTLLRAGCPEPRDRANVLVNLALAAITQGEPVAARARLAEARRALAEAKPGTTGATGTTTEWGNASPSLALWMFEIDARVALANGDAATALAGFRRQRALAEQTLAVDLAWRAAIGEGEALEALAKPELALEAYRRAEGLLDEASADVAILDARDAFLGDRGRSARALVDLLVRLGRAEEALSAARTARVRAISALFRADRIAALSPSARAKWDDAIGGYRRAREALDAESANDWQLAKDRLESTRAARRAREAALHALIDDAFALVARARPSGAQPGAIAPFPAPGPGELLLTHHPLRRGWVAFAADARGVSLRTLAALPTLPALPPRPADGATQRAVSDALLAPFRAQIEAATRVRVLPFGPLHAVDFHALPWATGALVDHATVEYALDLAASPSQGLASPDAAADPTGDFLLVADPTGDLPAARREAAAVTRALGAKAVGASFCALSGEAATSVAVLRALEHARWFHYAGHAAFAADDAWKSELPLADGGRLAVGDVLALPRAPAVVALFACESARTEARGEGIGLAQAFVTVGARAVIASTRPVADDLAADLATEMYGNVASSPTTDAPTLLRRAQIAVRERASGRDWGAFRAVVP